MNIKEAIQYLAPIAENAVLGNYKAALEMAIAALREQEERENPKPLTLEELRQMDGEPVWITSKNMGSGWCIVFWHGVKKSFLYFSKTGTAEGQTAVPVSAHKYGELWLAYRSKPKEDA